MGSKPCFWPFDCYRLSSWDLGVKTQRDHGMLKLVDKDNGHLLLDLRGLFIRPRSPVPDQGCISYRFYLRCPQGYLATSKRSKGGCWEPLPPPSANFIMSACGKILGLLCLGTSSSLSFSWIVVTIKAQAGATFTLGEGGTQLRTGYFCPFD